MPLRVVGAGLGRTGTMSLKVALEQLLKAPCYHMSEVFKHPDHVGVWHEAALGRMPDWHHFLNGYGAAVDWPVAAFWKETADAFPDTIIVHSTRDPQAWWESASSTIFPAALSQQGPWRDMIDATFARNFTNALQDRDACIAAYERFNANVRATADKSRLVEWQARDGWKPLCDALGIPVPSEPFPRVNSKEEFLGNFSALAPT